MNNWNLLSSLRRFVKDDTGSVLPMIGVMLASLMGTAGLTLDAGHSYFSYRQLQASTNAAALAGARQLPSTTAVTVATQYSSVAGNLNVKPGLTVTIPSGYPLLKCLTTLQNQGMPCASPANANAIQVKQTATINLYFSALLGKKTQSMTASATAAMRGASPTQYNVAIVMDTTLSMNTTDDNCGTTEMQCELNGVQTLLKTMTPCVTSSSSCTFTNGVASNSVDRVSLFVFPNVTSSTASIDSSCTTNIPSNWSNVYNDTADGFGPINLTFLHWAGNGWAWNSNNAMSSAYSGVPTAWPYSTPTAGASSYSGTSESLIFNGSTVATGTVTYQVTPYLSDYRTSGSATSLNTSSSLVKAVGGVANCGGILPPNFDGDYGTSYAGALYAAQASLVAAKAANPGSDNVLILLSDGNANIGNPHNNLNTMPGANNNNGNYPSAVGQCGQGVTAAKAATAAGTRVYTIAYGAQTTSDSGDCPTDVSAGNYPNITPCQALQDMASATQYFYSDYNQTGSNSNCTSGQPMTALNDIFQAIAGDMTTSRLIEDKTQ